jgi:hypothetical protein
MAEGLKHDAEKPRTDLLDAEFLLGVADVLKFGAKKYAEHNWRGGIAYSRLLGAILRHTLALLRGEDLDSESGLPHVHHLGCSVMFLSWMMTHRKDLDDRFKYETKTEGETIDSSSTSEQDNRLVFQRSSTFREGQSS